MLAEDDGVLVPVEVDGHAIMLSVPPDGLGGPRPDECKQDIVARPPSLHAALDALGSRLQDTGTCKVSIEFGGGEFAGESGGFVEVIGKASARSAFKVGLGWTKP
jgi:hypothetical protein